MYENVQYVMNPFLVFTVFVIYLKFEHSPSSFQIQTFFIFFLSHMRIWSPCILELRINYFVVYLHHLREVMRFFGEISKWYMYIHTYLHMCYKMWSHFKLHHIFIKQWMHLALNCPFSEFWGLSNALKHLNLPY